MRILVTGASGFLGHHLVRFLEMRHEVVGCWNSRPVAFGQAAAAQLDFTDEAQCRAVFKEYAPECVVHAGALTLTGDCERDPGRARLVNVEGTRKLMRAALETGGVRDQSGDGEARAPHFVYLSTDLVSNGQKPGGRYRENENEAGDQPDPLMIYGKSKLEAELVVREAAAHSGGTATILRSALIYGPPTAPSSCFLDWMVRNIREGTGTLFTDEYRSPVYVEDLCRVIETVCRRRADGLYHAGGPDRISRYEFGLLAARAFSLPEENVRGVSSRGVATGSPRPADVSLDISKARRELGYAPRPAQDGLNEIARLGYYCGATSAPA